MTKFSAYPRHAGLFDRVEPHLIPGELAHDRSHLYRVYRWAVKLAPSVPDADVDLCGAAAIVHDLVPIPKDSPERALGGEKSAAAAGPVLSEAGYSAAEVAIVVEAVRTSSWSRGHAPSNPVGVVLQDADRLDAIGAIGIARCIACAQQMSSADAPGRFYDPADPAARTDRALDDRLQAADHLPAKLLKLAAGMHTAPARAEARERHAVMLAWLEALEVEVRELNL